MTLIPYETELLEQYFLREMLSVLAETLDASAIKTIRDYISGELTPKQSPADIVYESIVKPIIAREEAEQQFIEGGINLLTTFEQQIGSRALTQEKIQAYLVRKLTGTPFSEVEVVYRDDVLFTSSSAYKYMFVEVGVYPDYLYRIQFEKDAGDKWTLAFGKVIKDETEII